MFTLFKSRATREMEAKLRFRRGKTRIQKYVLDAQNSSEKYWKLSADAYRLGDQEQFKLLAAQFLRLRDTITRWQRFMVKLEALELRRNEAAATRDFLLSVDELTSAINQGTSPKEIARMQLDIEQAIEKSKAQEEMLTVAMEAAGACMEGDITNSKGAFEEMERIFSGTGGDLASSGLPVRPVEDGQLAADVNRAIESLAKAHRS